MHNRIQIVTGHMRILRTIRFFIAGSLLYVLRGAGFTNIEFLDVDGVGNSKGWKKVVKGILLKAYIRNKLFWNKVTGSAYHVPSPMIFTWEIKCLARK